MPDRREGPQAVRVEGDAGQRGSGRPHRRGSSGRSSTTNATRSGAASELSLAGRYRRPVRHPHRLDRRRGAAPGRPMRVEAEAISASDPDRRLSVPGTRRARRPGPQPQPMLDRLQAAVDRERRVVDNASHELRTPLANLKAELDLALRQPRSTPSLCRPAQCGRRGRPTGPAGRRPARPGSIGRAAACRSGASVDIEPLVRHRRRLRRPRVERGVAIDVTLPTSSGPRGRVAPAPGARQPDRQRDPPRPAGGR